MHTEGIRNWKNHSGAHIYNYSTITILNKFGSSKDGILVQIYYCTCSTCCFITQFRNGNTSWEVAVITHHTNTDQGKIEKALKIGEKKTTTNLYLQLTSCNVHVSSTYSDISLQNHCTEEYMICYAVKAFILITSVSIQMFFLIPVKTVKDDVKSWLISELQI